MGAWGGSRLDCWSPPSWWSSGRNGRGCPSASAADAWAARSRQRRKEKLTLIRGDEADDEFVKSVERDLADLPVLDEHEDRPPPLEGGLEFRSARMWRNW